MRRRHVGLEITVGITLLLLGACSLTSAPTPTYTASPTLQSTSIPVPTSIPTGTAMPIVGPGGEEFRGPGRFEEKSALTWILEGEQMFESLQTLSLTTHVRREFYLDGSSYSSIIDSLQDCAMVLPADSYCVTETERKVVHFFSGENSADPEISRYETLVIFPRVWTRESGGSWLLFAEDAHEEFGVSENGLEHLRLSPYIYDPVIRGVWHTDNREIVLVLASMNVEEYYESTFGDDVEILDVFANRAWFFIDSETGKTIREKIDLSFYIPANEEATRRYVVYVDVDTFYYDFDAGVDLPSP